MRQKARIPAQVLEKARRLALEAADDEPSPAPLQLEEKQRRIREKVVAALKKLHPMD
jgi:hypothetical protein